MADLVIRGMNMPKTCAHCDLKRYDQERIWTDNGTELLGAWVCKRTDEIIWNTQRGKNCPLVPLPEVHGRPLTEPPEEGRVTKEDLFAAVRTIKDYCKSRDDCGEPQNDRCPFFTKFGATWCVLDNCVPCSWPDPEEGGSEDGT